MVFDKYRTEFPLWRYVFEISKAEAFCQGVSKFVKLY